MLIDANLLLFAADDTAKFHGQARDWLSKQLNGARRVAFAWQSLGAFLRIATHPRVFDNPLTPEAAWERITDWLECEVAWIPKPGESYAEILGNLVKRHKPTGNLVTDAQLAALALEHGLTVISADADFARFPEVSWENPLATGTE